MLKRINMLLILSTAIALVAGTAAFAGGPDAVVDSGEEVHEQHDQHGGTAGHLPATQENVRLVGKASVNNATPGRVADVGAFKDFAYLAAFDDGSCKRGGVYVFDISDPTSPKQVNFLPTGQNSYVGEGVQVIHVDTASFDGDLLVHNNEICGPAAPSTVGGLSLWDVTDPKRATKLAGGVGDLTPASSNGPGIAHEIHSTFAWDAGAKAYAVIVDDEEANDVDIMDITDPRAPTLIAEFNLNEMFPRIIQSDLGSGASFLHDMVVKKIDRRWVMLLSYWDGGYVTLDVTDPTRPRFLADSDFTNPDPEAAESGFTVPPEGNGHEAEFSLNNDFIVSADEDFAPAGLASSNTTDGTSFQATQGSNTPPIGPGDVVEGQTVFVGQACNTDPAVPPATDARIAVVERGVCTFTEKIANVEAAGGYDAAVVMNREGSDGCTALVNMSVEGNIHSVFVGRDTGFDFFDVPYDDAACRDNNPQRAPIDIGTRGDSVRFEGFFDGWGYAHLFANTRNKLTELDTYAIPEAHDPAFMSGSGDLSVHEAATSERRNDLVYFAYYAGGFRVARLQDDPADADTEPDLIENGRFIDVGGNNFWGVQVWQKGGKEFVLASDRDFGLYIFEYTGPGSPNG